MFESLETIDAARGRNVGGPETGQVAASRSYVQFAMPDGYSQGNERLGGRRNREHILLPKVVRKLPRRQAPWPGRSRTSSSAVHEARSASEPLAA